MGLEDYVAIMLGLWLANLLLLGLIWARLDAIGEEVSRLRRECEA